MTTKIKKENYGNNGNEETWQEERGRADIDGIVFILQKSIWLKDLHERTTNG